MHLLVEVVMLARLLRIGSGIVFFSGMILAYYAFRPCPKSAGVLCPVHVRYPEDRVVALYYLPKGLINRGYRSQGRGLKTSEGAFCISVGEQRFTLWRRWRQDVLICAGVPTEEERREVPGVMGYLVDGPENPRTNVVENY